MVVGLMLIGMKIKKKLDNINEYPEPTYSDTMNSRPLRISSIGDEGNRWGYNFSIIKQVPKNNVDKDTNKLKDIQTEETHDELDEYSRTLKNARKQGSGLRFPKSAIKSNPLRFRPYNREMVDDQTQKSVHLKVQIEDCIRMKIQVIQYRLNSKLKKIRTN
jgi:hypothetical protein